MCVYARMCVHVQRLTGGPQEQQHQDPIDPEEEECEEGNEGLQGEEGEMDEDFAGDVEQGDGERHAFPHEEHQQQQDDLHTDTVSAALRASAPAFCFAAIHTVKTVADTAYTSSAWPLSLLGSSFSSSLRSSFKSFSTLEDVSLPYSRWSM